jgi:hypothetical protein
MNDTTTEPTDQPKPKGAPAGNTNALRVGHRSQLLSAKVGNLPRKFRYIGNAVCKMGRQLEDAVLRRHGEITETRAALLNSCQRAEQAARLTQRFLSDAHAAGTLDATALTKLLTLQLNATKQRDAAIIALDLDSTPSDRWAGVFDATPALPSPQPTNGDTPHEGTEAAS